MRTSLTAHLCHSIWVLVVIRQPYPSMPERGPYIQRASIHSFSTSDENSIYFIHDIQNWLHLCEHVNERYGRGRWAGKIHKNLLIK